MADASRVHAIVLSDREGLIQHWNEGAEQLFGYPAAEALGKSLDLIVPPEYRQRHWDGFRIRFSRGRQERGRGRNGHLVEPGGLGAGLRADRRGERGRLSGRVVTPCVPDGRRRRGGIEAVLEGFFGSCSLGAAL
jgi:PAS domain-containing protein